MSRSRAGMMALVASAIFASVVLKSAVWVHSWDDPAIAFERAGFILPATAEVVFDKRDEHGLTGADGRRRIAVHVDEATLDRWLQIAPFHGDAKWKAGPITELQGYMLPPKDLCESATMVYALIGDMDDGSVVVLDKADKLAWLCWWY